MAQRLGLLIVLAATAAPADDKKSDPKDALAALKGKWEIVTASFDGKESAGLKGRVIIFDEKEFTTYDGNKKGRTISFTVDGATNPRHIDLERGADGVKALGIFTIGKDELKICYGEPGAERPAKFVSPAGDKLFLLVLKRAK
jgi:uncharacterized protein (TIGR03067 family)